MLAAYYDDLAKLGDDALRAELLAKARYYFWARTRADKVEKCNAFEKANAATHECEARGIDPTAILAEAKRTYLTCNQ